LLQAFSKVVLICLFAFHQPYLAENRCVNRYKIETTCSGKCVLVEVAGTEDDAQKSFPKGLTEVKEPAYCLDYFIELPELTPEKRWALQTLPPYKAPVSNAVLSAVFRPPAARIA